jgi:hypothetical protein
VKDAGVEGVENFHRVATQAGKNQQPTLGVRREVIDTSADSGHRNSLNEL